MPVNVIVGRLVQILIPTLALLAVVAIPGVAESDKGFRVGILSNLPLSSPQGAPVWGAFVEGLRDLGYVEGKNLTIVDRSSEGRYERLPELAAELVRLKVDVIVAPATQNVRAAQQASRTIPIVMAGSSNPVGDGLVASLARPGGNVTGVHGRRAQNTFDRTAGSRRSPRPVNVASGGTAERERGE